MKTTSTLAAVNRSLKATGATEKLRKGKGYWYFSSDEAAGWPQSAVYVYRVEQLTVAQWLAEHARLKAASRN